MKKNANFQGTKEWMTSAICGSFLVLNYLVWLWSVFPEWCFPLVADMLSGGIAALALIVAELCRSNASRAYRRSLRISALLLLPLLVLNMLVQGDALGLIAALVLSGGHVVVSFLTAAFIYALSRR